jgi:hypothetical protein
MAASSIFSHPIFQPGLVPVEEQRALSEVPRSPGQPLWSPTALAPTAAREVRLAASPDEELTEAQKLLKKLRRRRAGWLGHLRSFVAVNGGLAMINLLSSIGTGSMVPWVLYVTASWGIGFLIHTMTYRGWLSDHHAELERARALVGEASSPSLPASSYEARQEQLELSCAPTLPEGALDDGGWLARIGGCREALRTAREGLRSADVPADVGAELEGQLAASEESITSVYDAALAIRRAISEVAPKGIDLLARELDELKRRIAQTSDERLARLFEANRRLLDARREKLAMLLQEEERLSATVDGVRLAAENIRLDVASLGVGQLPSIAAALESSLRQLDAEVEIARHVENEMGRLC